MKLSDWAKQQGISYKTAYRWFRASKMPVPTSQSASGTILVHTETNVNTGSQAVLYGRVSSHDQKQDLQRQLQRLRDFAASKGLQVKAEHAEVASGLNSRRSKLLQILRDPTASPIIVEHRDRLARFGVPLLECVLKASGRELLVLNQGEHKDDLVQDFVDLATSMCARIYGRRSARNRAKRAVEAAAK